MTIRPLESKDLAHLPTDNFRHSGENVELSLVVVDADNRPILACSAERTIELHMVCGAGSPGVKLAAIRLLHEAMRDKLRRMGYTEASAWVESPKFGKRLERWFGWLKALPAWTVRI